MQSQDSVTPAGAKIAARQYASSLVSCLSRFRMPPHIAFGSYEKAIDATSQRLEQLEGFLRDYEGLDQQLETLPAKTSHKVAVPMGPLAFMEGHLHHTNEVLVLLGDNYFAERSAQQARGIVGRRIEHLQAEVRSAKQTIDRIHGQSTAAETFLTRKVDAEGNEVVEIREPYVSDEEEGEEGEGKASPSSASQGRQDDTVVEQPGTAAGDAPQSKKSSEEAEFAQFWDQLGKLADEEGEEEEGGEEDKEDSQDVQAAPILVADSDVTGGVPAAFEPNQKWPSKKWLDHLEQQEAAWIAAETAKMSGKRASQEKPQLGLPQPQKPAEGPTEVSPVISSPGDVFSFLDQAVKSPCSNKQTEAVFPTFAEDGFKPSAPLSPLSETYYHRSRSSAAQQPKAVAEMAGKKAEEEVPNEGAKNVRWSQQLELGATPSGASSGAVSGGSGFGSKKKKAQSKGWASGFFDQKQNRKGKAKKGKAGSQGILKKQTPALAARQAVRDSTPKPISGKAAASSLRLDQVAAAKGLKIDRSGSGWLPAPAAAARTVSEEGNGTGSGKPPRPRIAAAQPAAFTGVIAERGSNASRAQIARGGATALESSFRQPSPSDSASNGQSTRRMSAFKLRKLRERKAAVE